MRRDGGDCIARLDAAGTEAQGICNRSECTPLYQDKWVSNNILCKPECFTASCDWSRSMCSQERASIATCPLFDAIALASTHRARRSAPLVFVKGGSARSQCSTALKINRGRREKLFCLLAYARKQTRKNVQRQTLLPLQQVDNRESSIDSTSSVWLSCDFMLAFQLDCDDTLSAVFSTLSHSHSFPT